MINEVSRKLLDDFIAKTDADPNLPKALTDEDIIELALHLLSLADGTPMSMPLYPVYNLAVARFRLTRV